MPKESATIAARTDADPRLLLAISAMSAVTHAMAAAIEIHAVDPAFARGASLCRVDNREDDEESSASHRGDVLEIHHVREYDRGTGSDEQPLQRLVPDELLQTRWQLSRLCDHIGHASGSVERRVDRRRGRQHRRNANHGEAGRPEGWASGLGQRIVAGMHDRRHRKRSHRHNGDQHVKDDDEDHRDVVGRGEGTTRIVNILGRVRDELEALVSQEDDHAARHQRDWRAPLRRREPRRRDPGQDPRPRTATRCRP